MIASTILVPELPESRDFWFGQVCVHAIWLENEDGDLTEPSGESMVIVFGEIIHNSRWFSRAEPRTGYYVSPLTERAARERLATALDTSRADVLSALEARPVRAAQEPA